MAAQSLISCPAALDAPADGPAGPAAGQVQIGEEPVSG